MEICILTEEIDVIQELSHGGGGRVPVHITNLITLTMEKKRRGICFVIKQINVKGGGERKLVGAFSFRSKRES